MQLSNAVGAGDVDNAGSARNAGNTANAGNVANADNAANLSSAPDSASAYTKSNLTVVTNPSRASDSPNPKDDPVEAISPRLASGKSSTNSNKTQPITSRLVQKADATSNESTVKKVAKKPTAQSSGNQKVTSISEYSAKAKAKNKAKAKTKTKVTTTTATPRKIGTKSATKIDSKSTFKKPKGQKDDLKEIKGIGKVMEKTLNDMGVTTFEQLANFTKSDVEKLGKQLGNFAGRVERDRWIPQAKAIHKRNSKQRHAA